MYSKSRLQGHPIGFSNHFHLFDFNVQVLLFYFLCYFILYFFFFCSCLIILLILLLLEKMHAATLHGTTRGNNDIQVLKGVCRVTVCTAGPGLQGHPIEISNHFHLFGFNVQVLLFYFLFYFCYWRDACGNAARDH